MSINKRIKKYIKDKNISQVELSEMTGISITKLCMVLNGRRKISLDDYVTICKALNARFETFLG